MEFGLQTSVGRAFREDFVLLGALDHLNLIFSFSGQS